MYGRPYVIVTLALSIVESTVSWGLACSWKAPPAATARTQPTAAAMTNAILRKARLLSRYTERSPDSWYEQRRRPPRAGRRRRCVGPTAAREISRNARLFGRHRRDVRRRRRRAPQAP